MIRIRCASTHVFDLNKGTDTTYKSHDRERFRFSQLLCVGNLELPNKSIFCFNNVFLYKNCIYNFGLGVLNVMISNELGLVCVLMKPTENIPDRQGRIYIYTRQCRM